MSFLSACFVYLSFLLTLHITPILAYCSCLLAWFANCFDCSAFLYTTQRYFITLGQFACAAYLCAFHVRLLLNFADFSFCLRAIVFAYFLFLVIEVTLLFAGLVCFCERCFFICQLFAQLLLTFAWFAFSVEFCSFCSSSTFTFFIVFTAYFLLFSFLSIILLIRLIVFTLVYFV